MESERALLFADRGVSRQVLKDAIADIKATAVEKGIVRSGGGREGRHSTRCAISMIFRDQDVMAPKTGERNLTVGRKELLVEFQPGVKPPTFLKARIVPGNEVDIELRVAMERAFLSVKNEGIFEVSYLNALRQIIHRFVSSI